MREWFLAALLGAAAVVSARSSDAALLFNETWESGSTGWTTVTGTGPIALTSDTLVCSSQFQRETYEIGGGRAFSPAITVSSAGGTHCLTGWVRGSAGTLPFIGIRMGSVSGPQYWLIGQSGYATGLGDNVTAVTSDGVWHWYSKQFAMPSGYTTAHLMDELWEGGGPGEADFDDLRLHTGTCPTGPEGADHVVCTSPKPMCTTGGKCSECSTNADCSGTKPVCDNTTLYACRACGTDGECSGNSSGGLCLSSGACGCSTASHCPPSGPFCNTSTSTCSGSCTSDTQCGGATSGRICEVGLCIDGCRGSGGNGCPTGSMCSSTTIAAGVCAGSVDAGTVDTGSADTAAPDTAVADSGVVDTGSAADTLVADTAVPDTTIADTFVADTFVADTFVADTFLPDAAIADSTVVDSTATDSATTPDTAPAMDSASAGDSSTPAEDSAVIADTSTAETGDSPPTETTGEDGGCNCTTPRSQTAHPALLLLGLLLVRRRRR